MKLFSDAKKRKISTFILMAIFAGSLSGCGALPDAMTAGEDSSKSDSSKKDFSFGKDTELGTSSDSEGSSSEMFEEDSKEVQKKTDEIESIIDKYFYFDEDKDKREESYYDGIMRGLDDPYSVYYTQEEFKKLQEDDSGEFKGIGATISKDLKNGTISVVKPIKDSPAESVGLLPGDIIVQVDDMELTTDMELDYVVDHIRGEEGTVVKLKVYREGEKDYLTFDITRAKITNVSVEYEMLDKKVGYIKINEFINNTPELFKKAVDDLSSQGAKSMVFDLRSNPGGLLNAVINMVDYVIEDDVIAEGSQKRGLLLQTKDKDDNVLEEFSCSDGHSLDMPIAVLVNQNSASAAEIFTGCLKDYGVAKVVGTTTYGKGIVQSVIKLHDGSAVKITIAQYFLPSGISIHKVGVKPDVEVELNDNLKQKVDIEHSEDNQLQEALKQLD